MAKTNLDQYPAFRISVLRIQKSSVAQDVATHNQAMAEVVEQGNYEIKAAGIQDSASEIQIILVLQRRPVDFAD